MVQFVRQLAEASDACSEVVDLFPKNQGPHSFLNLNRPKALAQFVDDVEIDVKDKQAAAAQGSCLSKSTQDCKERLHQLATKKRQAQSEKAKQKLAEAQAAKKRRLSIKIAAQ